MTAPSRRPSGLNPLRGLEVCAVFLALVPLFWVLDLSGLFAWQQQVLPYPFFSEIGVLVALPIGITWLARRDLASEGFALARSSAPPQLALGAIGFTWLSTLPFLLLPALGATYKTLAGAAILAASNMVCGVTMLLATRRDAVVVAPVAISNAMVSVRVLVLLGAGVFGTLLTAGTVPVASRLLAGALITAFCEELFFRGYMQGGLDAAFGRRWKWVGISVGPGLFVAAVAFGCFHLVPFIAVAREIPWPWALWTTAFGIFAGALRAKSDSITLPWIMHGTLLAIRAIGSG